MTERMSDEQLDREIRGFLASQAEDVAGAPSATTMTTRISGRAGTARAGLRVAPQLVWVLLAGLLVIALVGALASGANRPPPAPLLPVAYEAVFLRVEVVGETHTVVVVGVNDEGRERQIARLPGAWAAFDVATGADERGFLAPSGAVSPTGLLAIPSDRGDAPLMMHWEIFDLLAPERDPVVVSGIRHFIESGGDAVWGPGERLAIPWYEEPECPVVCVTFVEGRTDAATTAVLQDLSLIVQDFGGLPYWASDGSGVFVGDHVSDDLRRVLRPDGAVVSAALVDALPSCRTRDASGAELVFEDVVLSDGGEVTAASLARLFPDGRREVLSSSLQAGWACLAPDDSAIIYEHELINPHTGAKFHPNGRFAGWLEITP